MAVSRRSSCLRFVHYEKVRQLRPSRSALRDNTAAFLRWIVCKLRQCRLVSLGVTLSRVVSLRPVPEPRATRLALRW